MELGSKKPDELILSIDCGTQSIRAGLVDLTGAISGFVKTPIEPYFSANPGWTEQHPEYYWQMLCKTCRKLLVDNKNLNEQICAVTITTQRATFINIDKDGRPLRPAILWLDQRKASSKRILPSFSHPFLKAVKLFDLLEFAVQYCRSNWIQQNQPEIWDRTHKYLYLSGYFTYKMTGQFRDSTGNIVGTIPFNLKRHNWVRNLHYKWWLFPMEKDKLPELVKSSEILGNITDRAAEETGIPKGLPLVAASNDKGCEILGAGCMSQENACISFGTTATINAQTEKYVELRPLMPPFPSAIPDQYYTEVAVMRGLWMVTWFKEEFGLQERLQALEEKVSPEQLLENLIKDVPPGSMGLVLQPYWMPGPELASAAKGSIIGFGDIHTRGHLYRAIIEGLVFALKEGALLTEKKTKRTITQIRASGGGSQSDSIVQITADIFGIPVERPHTHETSTLGAAITAAMGLEMFSSFEVAVKEMTSVRRVFEPVRENCEIYKNLYEKVYAKIYKRLLPLFKEIKEITGYPE